MLAATACGSDTEAAWAFDPIYLEPDGVDITGFQTWEYFTEAWAKRQAGKHYLCSVVITLQGSPTACDDCTGAWQVEPTILESDCPADLAESALPLSLKRVGIGPLSDAPDAPYPAHSSVSWADYGHGWERHGWAYPERLDQGRDAPASPWDGTEPYTLWPTSAWPL